MEVVYGDVGTLAYTNHTRQQNPASQNVTNKIEVRGNSNTAFYKDALAQLTGL
jgi:hypothetical protein